MSFNVPDDWDLYWRTCNKGHRFHASEGYCDRCLILEEEKRAKKQSKKTKKRLS